MWFRLIVIFLALWTFQLASAQDELELTNVYTFENDIEVQYADDWELSNLTDGVIALQRGRTDLIFATAPFIVTDALVSLEQIMESAIEIAETPIPPSTSYYNMLDFGDRTAMAYFYNRDELMRGIIAVIRMRDGTIGTLDIVIPEANFDDEQLEITAMLVGFNLPAPEETDTEDENVPPAVFMTPEEEFAQNANWRGVQSLNQGRNNAAIESFDIAIENNPNFAIYYENRGYAYSSLGDHELAIEDFTSAIALDSEVEYPYFYRAFAYVQLTEYELAIEDQTEAIRLNPTNALYYTDRGATKRRLGDFEGAIADYDQAIELDPDNPDSYFVRAMALAFIEDFDAATADFDKVAELDPESEDVIHLLQHYVDEDFEGAINGYSNHIFREPNFAPLYFHRGNAYRQIDDTENALLDLNQYIELAGDDADPRATEWMTALEG